MNRLLTIFIVLGCLFVFDDGTFVDKETMPWRGASLGGILLLLCICMGNIVWGIISGVLCIWSVVNIINRKKGNSK